MSRWLATDDQDRVRPEAGARIAVLDAIEAGVGATEPVTVGTVAANLGVDPSQSSRLVQAAIQAGAGRRRRRTVRSSTCHEAFQSAMSGWTSEGKRCYADLLERFVDNSTVSTAEQ